MGALAGVFPFDEVTVNYLRRGRRVHKPNARERVAPRVSTGNADIDAWWKNQTSSR
jgi:aconitase A